MRSPGNAVAFGARKNCTVAAQTRTRMERFIFSASSLYKFRLHLRRPYSSSFAKNLHFPTPLTLALSSNPPSPGSGAAGEEDRFLNASPARISLGAGYQVDRPVCSRKLSELRGRCQSYSAPPTLF